MQLVVTGMSFRTAPVEIRERASIAAADLIDLSPRLLADASILETVVLSTCNRIECYAVVSDVDRGVAYLRQALSSAKGIAPDLWGSYGYTYFNKRATQHLYRVAAGLDSLVVGEGEILGQLKLALAAAQAHQTAKTVLNALFQYALEAGKRVRSETDISKGSVSMGSAAVEWLERELGSLNGGHVLLFGAGQISTSTARRLQDSGVARITIANRHPDRAKALADEVGADIVSLSEGRDLLAEVTAAIVGTAAPGYVIGMTDLGDRYPAAIVDLGVPRQVDPMIAERPGLTLCHADELQSLVATNQAQREQYVAAAEAILDEELLKCISWFNSLGVTPLIGSLYALMDEIRTNEIERALRKHALDPQAKQVLEHVTKAIVQKILHHPVVQLKVETDEEKRALYAQALSVLFNLEAQTFEARYVHRPDRTVHA